MSVSIRSDTVENRLYIDLEGRLDVDEIADGAEQAVSAAEELAEGYDIITDLSGFKPPSPDAMKPIKEAQAELKEMGLDRVVRVIDEDTSEIVGLSFNRRSKDVGYTGERAETVEEAKEMLSEKSAAGHLSA